MSDSQMEDVRRRAESLLTIAGSAQDVKADVLTMASLPLPLSEKYHHIHAETMVMDNCTGASRQESLESLGKLLKALSILEKYGCNLTSPCRPKYWRTVKHNNPVFRTTVDAAQGGRAVLHLYGYTNQQPDGLSFPDDVMEPDVQKVAAVTVEVMTLRLELDLLIKEAHPHPETFREIIPALSQEDEVVWDAVVIPPGEEGGETHQETLSPTPSPKPLPHTVGKCNLCGGVSSLLCPSCASTPFCESCDHLFHRHPSRANHKRERIQEAMKDSCSICGTAPVSAHCSTCLQKLCLNCDRLFHSHPDRGGHNRTMVSPVTPQGAASPSFSSWECAHCTTVNPARAVLCGTCDRPRLANAASSGEEDLMQSPSNTEWQCKSCTVMNQGASVLCEVCERPRLASRPPVTPVAFPSLASGLPAEAAAEWTCQVCTYQNSNPSVSCEMCDSPCKDPAGGVSHLPSQKDLSPPPLKPRPLPRDNDDLRRQETLREEGLALVTQIREGEKRGVTPEEVYASLRACGGSSVNPCDWLQSELPHLLDEICAMAASVQQNYKTEDSGMQDNIERDDGGLSGTLSSVAPGEGIQLSRAEAKQAWLLAGGDTERAVRQLLRDRQAKMKELRFMGFRELSQCEEALRQSGGELRGALSLLQRPLLEPFHQRIWSNQPEALLDPKDPDKQKLCRRLLALYDLPSWGRCELALSLLQEPDAQYSLEDVVQAVRESQDRGFIRRLLNKECPCCFGVFPHSKMQSLTSCQCAVCHHCFKQHFTLAIRDKHIRDMVCPICLEPDINELQQLDSYFSTLDIQVHRPASVSSLLWAQVISGKYTGLIWDDEAKTMFRIPWKHAGKQDFRSDEDAAIFKAWAEFKGKLSHEVPNDPAYWKTRLRCALNKSPEFQEMPDRSQLDLSEPYKVYRLVPNNEQGLGKEKVQSKGRGRRLKRTSSESDSEEDMVEAKHMKKEVSVSSSITMAVESIVEPAVQSHEALLSDISLKNDGTNDEIQLNFTIETEPARGDDSFVVSVSYLGKQMLSREVKGNDVRITYMPSSPTAPSLIVTGFPRILLPDPPSSLSSSPEAGPRLQALATLLPFMERGVMLTSTGNGVYAKRFCQGRVFWTGPHATSPGPHKMERTPEPIKIFNKDIFQKELEHFRVAGGTPPQCGFTLCFGEELTATDDPSCKLIIAQITLSWAERHVHDAISFRESIAFFQNLANQSPLGEITLNLEAVSMPCSILADS